MRKNLFSKAMAMLLSAGLVCTMLPAVPVSAEELAVSEPAEQVLSLSTTTTTTAEPTVDACYSTLVEYDKTELAVGDTMEVRFWNPETGECAGGDISEVSDNISYEYKEGTDTICITALSAGVGRMYVRESTCAFGAYVMLNVTDGQITTAATTTTAFTGTMTTPPTGMTVETTLRTTETIAPDETELEISIDKLEIPADEVCICVEFGQTLENVYSIMFDIAESQPYEYGDVYVRFDMIVDDYGYQVLYPMNLYSYSSKDGWWAEIQLANNYSYATVKLPDGSRTTVSQLDTYDSELADKLLAELRTCSFANIDILGAVTTAPIESTSETTETTTVTTVSPAGTYNTTMPTNDTTTTVTTSSTIETSVYDYTIPAGQSVTVPVYYEDLNSTVETVTVDGGNSVLEITELEYLESLVFNIHILTIAPGEDVIRLSLDDGGEFTIRIIVTEALTTSVTTAVTVSTSNTPDTGNTTLPTTYYSTTFPTTSYRTTTTPLHTTMTATTTSTAPIGTNTGAGGEETGTTVVTIATTGTTISPETGRHNADANFDGSIDLDDAVSVITVYACNAAGLTSEGFTEEQAAAADADGDGTVTLEDAAKIITYYSRKAAGLNPSWVDII